MHTDLLIGIAKFVNDPVTRFNLGFPYERCVALRIPPLRLNLARFNCVLNAYQARLEAQRYSVSRHIFHIQLYVPAIRAFIMIMRDVTRNYEIVCKFCIDTNVDLNYETMVVTSPCPQLTKRRRIVWHSPNHVGALQCFEGFDSYFGGFADYIVD
jgi:hypothetical protein